MPQLTKHYFFPRLISFVENLIQTFFQTLETLITFESLNDKINRINKYKESLNNVRLSELFSVDAPSEN